MLDTLVRVAVVLALAPLWWPLAHIFLREIGVLRERRRRPRSSSEQLVHLSHRDASDGADPRAAVAPKRKRGFTSGRRGKRSA
jgi:hypothetical protein